MGRSRGVPNSGDDDTNHRSKRRRVASSGDASDSLSAACGGAGDGKKALYHCNYCNKDLSGKIRIKCSKCPDFDLCVECFSVGAEVTPHRSNHPYRVMDNLSFPLICPDWNADEEILLLEGIEMYGLGNWAEVAEHVGTKGKTQCIDHYTTAYMNSPCYPLPDMSHVNGKNRKELLAMAKVQGESKKGIPVLPGDWTPKDESPFSPPRVKVEDALLEGPASRSPSHIPGSANKKASTVGHFKDGANLAKVEDGHMDRSIGVKKPRCSAEEGPSLTELSGYNAKRHEFDPEYDNDAEQALAEMEFKETDSETDRELKLRVLRIYLSRLDERKRRKEFILERNLLYPPPPATPAAPSPPSTTPSPPADRSPPSPPAASPPPSSSSGLTTPVVVGIAVGGLIALLLASLLCFCLLKKKKRRHHPHHPPPPPPPHHLHYYGHPPPPPPPPPFKGDQYGGAYQNWQHNAPPPPPPDHVVKMHSHPPPKPAPPPVNVNSSGSGSNYSGGGENRNPQSPLGNALSFSRSTFTYEDLAVATDQFSDANLLGQGGFGFVHKGVLPDGTEVAVKQLRDGSGQGEREFQAEVEIISRVHHKHLVTLVGYCISEEKRLLVYEFVPNNTLEFHLHGRRGPTMDWPARLRIALGSAKGLAYLHEDCHPKIIHRDIKAANILMDHRFEAKVADFGLAKLTPDNDTHVSTRVMGTFGYLAPEYASSGKLTEKSDVFSFGVMLLELITGRRPVSSKQAHMDDSLVDWARPLMTRALQDGNHDALVDPQLGTEFNDNEMARMIACAAACVRHSGRRRPRMSQVVRALEGDVSLDDLNEGVRPGHSRFMGSHASSEYDTSQYNEDLKKFRKMALGTSSFQSSQQTPSSSEHGHQEPSTTGSDSHHQTQEMEMGTRKRDSDEPEASVT